MKNIDVSDDTRKYRWLSYQEIVDTFECETLVLVETDDWQGESFYLLRKGEDYGILIFGWGSCSGCDELQEIYDGWPSGHPSYVDYLNRELTVFRDRMYEAIVWRSRDDMISYISAKDFTLEWYGNTHEGRVFIKKMREHLGVVPLKK